MKLLRTIIIFNFLCAAAIPVRMWPQIQGMPAATSSLPSQAKQSAAATAELQPPHPAGDAAAGARTFSTNCAGCHGSDGRGGERAHNIATARQVMALSDSDLISILRNGITGLGMPSFAYLQDKGINDVLAYLRVLQGKVAVVKVKGDDRTGRDLFYGKAGCAQCHMVKGQGGFLGPDLTDFASGLTLENIELSITRPDAQLQPNQSVVSVLLTDGTTVQGTARSEDNFTVTLQEQNGRFRTFNKQRVGSIHHSGHSIMPKDYASKLSSKELDDLVSYLVAVSADAAAKPARGRRQQ